MYNLQEATAHVASKIASLKEEAAEIYNHPDAQLLSHRVNSDLDRLLNHLLFMTGTQPVVASSEPMFKPLTSFMGEPMNFPKQLNKADLSPSEVERETYRDKVSRLYEQIDTIAVDGILNSYTIPEDVAVLRGVAKIAGVEGYEDRPIDEAFVNAIIVAKAAKLVVDKEQAEIDRQLKEQADNGKSPTPAGAKSEDDSQTYLDHTLTDYDLELNPELANYGFKAGDTIQIPNKQDIELSEGEIEAAIKNIKITAEPGEVSFVSPKPTAVPTEPVGNKIDNPAVKATEATATEAKAPAVTGNEQGKATENKPAVDAAKTVTPAATTAEQGKQQEKNTGGKNKGK